MLSIPYLSNLLVAAFGALRRTWPNHLKRFSLILSPINVTPTFPALPYSLAHHFFCDHTSSTEKSLEIDQLRHALEAAKSEKMNSEELVRAKLDALSLDHSLASEEVQKLQQDLATLRKERDGLSVKVRDEELASNLSSDLQISTNQLQHMEEERNIMMAEIEKLRGNEVEVKLLGKACDEKISRAQLEAEQLSGKLADLEHKMHDDGVKNGKERTKLRMRLRSTQAKLDAFRERYKDAIEEQEFMHKKFEEASTMLKDRLSSYGLEILNLKKQVAASKAS